MVLKHFKTSGNASSSPSLPEPNGLLSKVVPSKAIKLMNAEVAKLCLK